MNRDDASRWALIINEDLVHARRRLTPGYRNDLFLRNRIVENEAILSRLAELARVSDVWVDMGRPPAATV
jgi:hypothetical protein